MLSPNDYRAFKEQARRDATEYREDAEKSNPTRRDMLLKWAKAREEDAAWYEQQERYYQ